MGDSLNSHGFGSTVMVYNNDKVQMQEQNPVRGYFSSVDQKLVFGLGINDHADSLVITWPGGQRQSLKNLGADTTLVLSIKNAVPYEPGINVNPNLLFTDITSTRGINYRHQDNSWNDYVIQQLLPQKFSQLGPFIATGDINRDGSTDFFIGGGLNFSGKIFMQKPGQTFISKDLMDSIKFEEDMDCILLDADNDGDSDLVVSSGGMQYEENSIYYKPRLYVNDGKGNFSLQPGAFPDSVRSIAGCVTAGDYDGDGDQDLFIGGRVSKTFPVSPRSWLLQNNHGVFTDVTKKICPALQNIGMVTAAVWTDYDNDRQPDLIIAGEWMPLRFFSYKNEKFIETTASTGLTQMNGMWRSLVATDADNDGDIDLVAGNLGLNCKYRVSAEQPMELFATDLDGNGSVDPVIFYFIKESDGEKKSFPAISRNQFSQQVPSIKKQFLLYKDYSHASYDDIFKKASPGNLLKLYCDETRSCYFENAGNGKFIKHALPVEAQFAPVNAIICDDMDNDGYKDLLLAGNEYQAEVNTGRYDASYGCFLRGSSNKSFIPVPQVKSGFILNGDVKDLSLIQLSNGNKMVLAAVNNDSLRVFSINAATK
jgi:hypothetical protein